MASVMGNGKHFKQTRYAKKILVEEGHSIPNLIHIFQLIVRHSDLFYSCRAQFVSQMVNSLSRLGLPYNTTSDNRWLAIELAGLVVNRERQRQNEMKIVDDGDGSSQNNDVSSITSNGADPKRSVDGPTLKTRALIEGQFLSMREHAERFGMPSPSKRIRNNRRGFC